MDILSEEDENENMPLVVWEQEVPLNCTYISTLPTEIIEHVLKYVSYKDIVNFRLINTRFHEISTQYLNSCYCNVGKELFACRDTTAGPLPIEKRSGIQRKMKVLNCLRAEYQVLHAICWKYIEHNRFPFFGRDVVSEFNRVLDLCKKRRPLNANFDDSLSKLRKLNEIFVDKLLRCVKNFNLEKMFLDIMDIEVCSSILPQYRTLTHVAGVGQLEYRFQLHNTYLLWGCSGAPHLPEAQEFNSLFRFLIPFLFSGNKPHENSSTTTKVIGIGEKRFKIVATPTRFPYGLRSCHSLVVSVCVQFPADDDQYQAFRNHDPCHWEESPNRWCEMNGKLSHAHRLFESLPQERFVEFRMSNFLCPASRHKCPRKELCWRKVTNMPDYVLVLENTWDDAQDFVLVVNI